MGDDAFGLWVLIFSVTGYYGLFDLGIRSSIIRYVAKYSTVAENEELNRLVNTAFFAYSGIGAVALLITVAVSFYVGSIFRVSGDSVHLARWLFLMVGTAVALGFPLGVFGGILEGLQRFYVLNLNNMSSTLLRALLIVIALQHGRGLLTVASSRCHCPCLQIWSMRWSRCAFCLYALASRISIGRACDALPATVARLSLSS